MFIDKKKLSKEGPPYHTYSCLWKVENIERIGVSVNPPKYYSSYTRTTRVVWISQYWKTKDRKGKIVTMCNDDVIFSFKVNVEKHNLKLILTIELLGRDICITIWKIVWKQRKLQALFISMSSIDLTVSFSWSWLL